MPCPLPPLVVTGAQGRLGRILRHFWHETPPKGLRLLWHARDKTTGTAASPPDLIWDLAATAPPANWPHGALILHLAGAPRAAGRHETQAIAQHLLGALKSHSAQHLILASSAAVYDFHAQGPGAAWDETRAAAPPSAYGQEKLAIETLCRARLAPERLTILRLGNVVGADALFGQEKAAPITLDPVPPPFAPERGPLRSWIGPRSFAHIMAQIVEHLAHGQPLPSPLNLAQAPGWGMAELLRAAQRPWRFGPANPTVLPSACLDTQRLQRHFNLCASNPEALIGELSELRGLEDVHQTAF